MNHGGGHATGGGTATPIGGVVLGLLFEVILVAGRGVAAELPVFTFGCSAVAFGCFLLSDVDLGLDRLVCIKVLLVVECLDCPVSIPFITFVERTGDVDGSAGAIAFHDIGRGPWIGFNICLIDSEEPGVGIDDQGFFSSHFFKGNLIVIDIEVEVGVVLACRIYKIRRTAIDAGSHIFFLFYGVCGGRNAHRSPLPTQWRKTGRPASSLIRDGGEPVADPGDKRPVKSRGKYIISGE